MIFTSIDFLIFFGIVLGLYFFIPTRLKWIFLLAASLVFYGYRKPIFLVYLTIPILLVYGIALRISSIRAVPENQKKRKTWLILGLISALSTLAVFRYTDFFFLNFHYIFGGNTVYKPFAFILPIGLSFYSFKMVSYLVDVYRENAPVEKHLGYFSLYVSFFPQILSGPIDRAVNFIPELKKKVDFDIDRIREGFQQVLWGIFKKMVIADRLSIFIDITFANPKGQGLNLLFAAYFYAFQIYCDFSGYTDMAIGISKILGFQSMKNFDFPYFSKSITQFWNGWHISLSTWLRDYLFLPIAYAVMRPIKSARLLKIKAETWGYIIGMSSTMLIAGLWHGPRKTYIIWGGLHGLFLIISYLTKKTRKKLVKTTKINKLKGFHSFLRIFITFNMVSFAWIFFRCETLDKALYFIKYIQLKPSGKGFGYLMFSLFLVVVFILLEIIYKNKERISIFKHVPGWVRIAGYALVICLIIIFAVDTSNEFIYFQF